MNASGFIADRLKFHSRAATVSIVVSFVVMIVAVAITDGFSCELGSEFAKLCGDISVKPAGGASPAILGEEDEDGGDVYDGGMPLMEHPSRVMSVLGGIEGIDKMRPVLYDMAVIRGDDNIQGVMFRGTDDGPDSACVVVPRPLARRMSLSEGDRMLCYFPGERLIARKFTVSGIYDPVVSDEDKMTVMCGLKTLAAVRNVPSGAASVLEISLKDSYRGEKSSIACKNEISWRLYSAASDIGESLYAVRKQDEYPQIFSWLRLIRNNVSFILILMTIVAAFNMTGSLLILLFENTRTIGLLKALGMTDRDISLTFLKLSARLVAKAMCIGNFVGVGIMLIQKYSRLVKLDADNYFLPFVPVSLDYPFILLCDAGAFVLILAVLMLPCRFISSVQPSRTLTVE